MNEREQNRSGSSLNIVLFDLGGVLMNVNVSQALQYWVETTGKASAIFEQHLFTSGLKEKMDKGLCSSEEVMALMEEKTGLLPSDFEAGWRKVLTPMAEMMPLLTAVTEVFPSGLLSNTDPIHHAVARELLPQLARLTPQFVSYTEGCWKPELPFYEQILKALPYSPSSVFFVDDLEENVEGAKRAGLDAVVFESPEQLRRALMTRGVPLISEEESP